MVSVSKTTHTKAWLAAVSAIAAIVVAGSGCEETKNADPDGGVDPSMVDAGPCEGDPDGGECDLLAEFFDKPYAYVLTHARAVVTIQRRFLFDFVLDPDEMPLAGCTFFPGETTTPIVTANFQVVPDRQSDNFFSFWDNGESAYWGLYDHATGEEWTGSASGSADVSLQGAIRGERIVCYGGCPETSDDYLEWVDSGFLPMLGVVRWFIGYVQWQGVAGETFSGEKVEGEVEIYCLWQRLNTSLSSGSLPVD